MKATSFTELTFNPDVPAMRFHQQSGYIQTKTDPAGTLATLDLKEPLEEARTIFGRDPHPFIGNRNNDFTARLSSLDNNFALGR